MTDALENLIKDLRRIAETATLPDGDHVSMSVVSWVREWVDAFGETGLKATPTCGTCHYFDEAKCRRWPPRWIVADSSVGDAGWDWPGVSGKLDWCGEWREA